MHGAVFLHEVSSWFCSVLIELYIEGHTVRIMDRTANCGGWELYLFPAHFKRKLWGGLTRHFRYYRSKLNFYLSHT